MRCLLVAIAWTVFNRSVHRFVNSLRRASRGFAVPLALLAAGFWCRQTVWAQPALTLTPAVVSNTYPGFVTLQVTGLTNGEPVLIGKFLDVNANGVIDAADLQVQGFRLVDGQATVIGGVTNLNVPGDWDAQGGRIRVPLSFPTSGIDQQIVGQYIYAMVSPGGRFLPVTVLFGVTNSSFAQSVSGTVRSGGSSVPYATVMLFTPPTGNGGMDPVAGAVANASGNYQLKAAPGTYLLWAFKSNYVANIGASPIIALGAGSTVTTNLSLLAATVSISGRLVDAGNPNIGLPSMLVAWQSSAGELAAGFCDTNGGFTVPVVAGQWEFGGPGEPMSFHGYPTLENNPQVDTSTGNVAGVTIAFPKATVLVWGTVTNSQGQPLAGVRVEAGENNWAGPYSGEATTDQNGNYFLGLVPGLWWVEVHARSGTYANYVFSPGPGNINLADGQALRMDFGGLVAPSRITGSVVDGVGSPIGNIGVYAHATIDGTEEYINGGADSSGNFVLSVPNGSWNVGVVCTGSSESLTPRGYLCVGEQTVSVNNSTGRVSFVALQAPYHITGRVSDQGNQALTFLEVAAHATINNASYEARGTTDGNGNYSLNVANGTWSVGLECYNGAGLIARGYQCQGDQIVVVANNSPVLNFTVSPRPPLQITTTSLPNGQVGFPYMQTLFATGGQPPYHWSFASGSGPLPDGLGLSSDGVIFGIPTTPGTNRFSVHAWDDASSLDQADQPLSITIDVIPMPRPMLIPLGRYSNSQFLFTFDSVVGFNYTAQYSTDVYNWSNLTNRSGTGGQITITDPNASDGRRFYRLQVTRQ